MEKMKSNEIILEEHGLKNTKQRNLVLDEIKASEQPLTVEQIFLSIQMNHADISLSTVYRTIETLCEKGIITKSMRPSDHKVMVEMCTSEHRHHLICLECKEITSIDHCPVHQFEKSIEDQTNFQVTGHYLEMYGYCSKCTSKQKDLETKKE